MTDELSASILEQIGKGRRGPTAWAAAKIPPAAPDMGAALSKVCLEGRPQTDGGQQGERILREMASFLDLDGADAAARWKQGGWLNLAKIPRLGELSKRREILLEAREEIEGRTEHLVQALPLELRGSFG